MPKRKSSNETGRGPVASYDDQWITWADGASEVEWACVALAGFGAVASRVRAIRDFARPASESTTAR